MDTISLEDWRLGKRDEIWHDCHEKEVATSTAMLKHPGIWVEYSVPLRDSMTSRKEMEPNPPEPVVPTTEEPPLEEVFVLLVAVESSMRVGLMYVSSENTEDTRRKKLLGVLGLIIACELGFVSVWRSVGSIQLVMLGSAVSREPFVEKMMISPALSLIIFIFSYMKKRPTSSHELSIRCTCIDIDMY